MLAGGVIPRLKDNEKAPFRGLEYRMHSRLPYSEFSHSREGYYVVPRLLDGQGVALEPVEVQDGQVLVALRRLEKIREEKKTAVVGEEARAAS